MRRREFERVVIAALERLPEQFRNALDNVDIEVRWRPTPAELRRAGVGRQHLLFGTYTGIPRSHRGHNYTMALPDKIIIYQEPHERVCADEEAMIAQAERTLRHEIGHYLGMPEEQLRKLGLG
ncbi:MAG TPA: metallopeptidase family protein [Dehalococcoidia bacterium]|nr:metallopeptidase family protein [Dehalococcoidia bacterium]